MDDRPDRKTPPEREMYHLLEELDRCESLLEDLDDLGLATRDDIVRHMEDLHRRLDALESG
jgi:hypothetical protein